ncbi:MAG TPA: hypothetical protein VLF66_19860 [Thermoanaerobaculia bacterium]|nr:hypothetical protein [Thermoanaerobaculia bacterium]
MRTRVHRIVSVLVLVAWATPGVGALGVALHVALHHAPEGGERGAAVSELGRAAPHGHHHGAAAALDHRHEVEVADSAPALRPAGAVVAVLPAPASLDEAPAERPHRAGPPRRAPPAPLFATHCSLLL